jgi:hypothetical protein
VPIFLVMAVLAVLSSAQTTDHQPPWLSHERGGQDLDPHFAPTNALFSRDRFCYIPGPNQILVRGGKVTWDKQAIESCDIIKNSGTYYYFYRALALDTRR